MSDARTLVIGDVHGHVDRLEALLAQEGLLDESGARQDTEAVVVQLGDLGHFGETGSPTGDRLAYELARDAIDVVLWGNHDRAVVDGWHAFTGYRSPSSGVEALLKEVEPRLAYAAHGFLVTHAGLHKQFKYQRVDPAIKGDPALFAAWVNQEGDDRKLVVDPIGHVRGGRSPYGGILWRHSSESLYPFRQIFGHSVGDRVRKYQGKAGDSYCIDVGTQRNGRLAGIWLPEERVVEVRV